MVEEPINLLPYNKFRFYLYNESLSVQLEATLLVSASKHFAERRREEKKKKHGSDQAEGIGSHMFVNSWHGSPRGEQRRGKASSRYRR